MRATHFPDLSTSLYKHIRGQLQGDREGWHLSDFLYCNYKAFYRKRGEAPESTDETILIYWLGHAAQYFLLPVKPEEAAYIEVDGIKMTPDVQNQYFAGHRVALAEMKSTRSNMSWFKPTENKHYIMQMMGYCKGLGVTEAELIMFFLMGNYKPPFPALDCWHFEFTQKEIDDNWREVLRRRDILQTALAEGEFPRELIMAFAGECKYCECREMCPRFNSWDMGRDTEAKNVNV